MTHPMVSRSGVPQSALPLISAVCGAVAVGASLVVTAKAHLLYGNVPWGPLLCVAASGAGAVVGWWGFRLLGFRYRPLTPRIFAVAVVLGAATVWGVHALASEVWKTASQRYTDELGGPGACLAGTPYGEQAASVITVPQRSGHPMEVWPGTVDGSKEPVPTQVLRLTFADNGSRPLAPADDASRELLRAYGCH
ncbi:hypothetical protein [Streptomyces sp. A0642]|uniref:hypothetical protein n=1 Tax=Streptomyces sp. A0642 TaxID=2563100 RepID=UPI0019CFACAD|nr:hypothetical protein [Streptomyces sp. A0642]